MKTVLRYWKWKGESVGEKDKKTAVPKDRRCVYLLPSFTSKVQMNTASGSTFAGLRDGRHPAYVTGGQMRGFLIL